jgi:hypothetical protein
LASFSLISFWMSLEVVFLSVMSQSSLQQLMPE